MVALQVIRTSEMSTDFKQTEVDVNPEVVESEAGTDVAEAGPSAAEPQNEVLAIAGFEARHVDIIMSQTQASRRRVEKELRENKGDLRQTIIALLK